MKGAFGDRQTPLNDAKLTNMTPLTNTPISPLETIKYDVVQAKIHSIQGDYCRAVEASTNPVDAAWIQSQSIALQAFEDSLDPGDPESLERALEVLNTRTLPV